VSQDVVIREEDCGTKEGIYVKAVVEGTEVIESLKERIVGRIAREDIIDPNTGEIIVRENEEITEEIGRRKLKIAVAGIPIISRIYSTIQQISRAFLSEKREVFKKAVLFEYPRPGTYSIGFFTQDTKGMVQDALDCDVVSVFLPTTPNPTSGFLLFVPKTEIIELDMPVEEALKLVISGGAIVPQSREKRPPSISPAA